MKKNRGFGKLILEGTLILKIVFLISEILILLCMVNFERNKYDLWGTQIWYG